MLFEAATLVPERRLRPRRRGPRAAAASKRSPPSSAIADRVHFLGRRGDVPELLAACDVFALPSLYEGTSLAVLEAMAARRPVVSSAIGGTDELIDDGEPACWCRRATPRPGRCDRPAARQTAGLRDSFAARARERVEARIHTARRWPTG